MSHISMGFWFCSFHVFVYENYTLAEKKEEDTIASDMLIRIFTFIMKLASAQRWWPSAELISTSSDVASFGNVWWKHFDNNKSFNKFGYSLCTFVSPSLWQWDSFCSLSFCTTVISLALLRIVYNYSLLTFVTHCRLFYD